MHVQKFHACEMLMLETCIVCLPTLISHGSFSHTFHTLFTWFSHITLIVTVCRPIVNIISAYAIILQWKFSYIFNSQCSKPLLEIVTYGRTNCSLDDTQCSGTLTERIYTFFNDVMSLFYLPSTSNANIQHYAFVPCHHFMQTAPKNNHFPKEPVANYI